MTMLCSDEVLAQIIDGMRSDPEGQLEPIDVLLADFPEDARLHFLRGSILAGAGRLIEAYGSLSRAVEIAPDYALARFQLGLFQLTSGEPENALDTFGRLDRLPDGHYLRKFVDGLRCLIRDDFVGTVENLKRGIQLNTENPPMNNDMQLLVDQCQQLISAAPDGGAVSETSLILNQFSGRTIN